MARLAMYSTCERRRDIAWADSCILDINRSLYSRLRCGKEDMVGSAITRFVRAADVDDVVHKIEDVQAKGKVVFDLGLYAGMAR